MSNLKHFTLLDTSTNMWWIHVHHSHTFVFLSVVKLFNANISCMCIWLAIICEHLLVLLPVLTNGSCNINMCSTNFTWGFYLISHADSLTNAPAWKQPLLYPNQKDRRTPDVMKVKTSSAANVKSSAHIENFISLPQGKQLGIFPHVLQNVVNSLPKKIAFSTCLKNV